MAGFEFKIEIQTPGTSPLLQSQGTQPGQLSNNLQQEIMAPYFEFKIQIT